jgi:beta-galactosidase
LLLVGPDAHVNAAALRASLAQGGKEFFLPRAQADGGLGATLKPAAADFAGSMSVPRWPKAKGLSASDLRWRTHLDAAPWIVSAGAETGANGLLGRMVIGKGVAVFCQIDPDRFQADQKTYFRYTRWRSTRAVAQLLANLGAGCRVDGRIFHPLDTTVLNRADPLADQPEPQATGAGNGAVHVSPRPKPGGSNGIDITIPIIARISL